MFPSLLSACRSAFASVRQAIGLPAAVARRCAPHVLLAVALAAGARGRLVAQTKPVTISVSSSVIMDWWDSQTMTQYARVTFTVKNNGTQPTIMYLWPDCGAWCVDDVPPSDGFYGGSVQPGQTITFQMSLEVDQGDPGSGPVSLVAQGYVGSSGLTPTDTLAVFVDLATRTVSPLAKPRPSDVTTSPNGTTVWVSPGVHSLSFTVKNNSPAATSAARETLTLQCGGYTYNAPNWDGGTTLRSCGMYVSGYTYLNEQTPYSLSISPGASAYTSIAYQAVAGQTGYIRLIMTMPDPATGGTASDTASVFVVVGDPSSPNISVTPANGTTITTSPISQLRVDWCDPDDALVQHDLTWQGQLLPNVYTSTTRAGCYSAGSSVFSNLAISPGAQNLVATARDAAGHVVTTTTTITFLPPLTMFKPTVTATSGWHRVPGPGDYSSVDTFVVKNSGTSTATYVLVPACDGTSTLTSCYIYYPNVVTLDPDATFKTIVYFTRSGMLDYPDTLKLVATYRSPDGRSIADTGRRVVISETTYKPQIARYGPTNVSANGRRSFAFNLLDAGNASATYTLTVSCTGALTSCTLPNSSATMTKALSPSYWGSVAVGFNTGAGGTTGQIRLIMTAPPRPSDGVVEADTSLLTVNAADVAAPTVAIQPFGYALNTANGPVNYVSTDTATILVDVCDIDGTVGAPTLKVSGVVVVATSVVATTVSGCFTSKRATYKVSTFFDGIGDVTGTASDGFHTGTNQVWYQHDGAPQSTPRVTAVHPTLSVVAGYASTDTFVVANTGPQTVSYLLAFNCSPNPYWLPCGMSQASSYVTVASGASVRIPFSYSVAGVGSSVSAYLSATYEGVSDTTGASARFVATAVGTIPPTIAVTPANGATVTSSPISQVRVDWCDADDALVQHDVTWQGQPLPDTYVATTRSGCATAGTSTYNNLAINLWQQTLVATARDIANHTVTATANITYAPPLATFAPHVTATAGLRRLPAATSSPVADTFTVTNAGSSVATYAMTVGCGRLGTLANCSPSPGSLALAPGASSPVIVQYTRAGATDVIDTLKLIAAYTSPIGGVIADTALKLIVAPSVEAAASVAPMQSLFQVWPRATVGQAWFSVRNTSSVPETFTLYLVASSGWGFMTTSVTPTLTMTVQVAAGQTQYVSPGVVTPSTAGVSGTISLTTSYLNTAGQTLSATAIAQLVTADQSGSGTIALDVTGTVPILAPNGTRTATFTVRNTGTASGVVIFTRTCTGAVIATCTTPSPSSATLAGGASTPVTVNVTAGATAGQGTVTLIATSGSVTSSASLTVSTGIVNGPISISLANQLNPGTSIARDQCLTIAAGDDAAYECGDLRLVHALPTTTTMNKARTPTLIYMSAHAQPVTLVQADVTIDGANTSISGSCAMQIKATVRFAATDTSQSIQLWNGLCGQAATRRIVIPVDARAHSHLTGLYRYSLEVQATTSNGATFTATDTTGVMAVVERSTSPFGSGWWIDGVEQLQAVPNHNDQLLWIAGDGSTRLYTQQATDTFVVRPTLDRPDSIVALRTAGAITEYRRKLRNGAYVSFDAYYRHIATVNTLGHTTQFMWHAPGSPQLDSIVLPVPIGAPRRVYAFVYTSGLLTSVIAPAATFAARGTTLTRNGNDLLITDPGVAGVHYISDASGRITVRRNRLGDGTRFDYDATASVLTRVALDMSRNGTAGDSIRSTFCPAEAVTVVSCANALVDPGAVRTLLDGPRVDVQDVTAFYVTRFGAPRAIIDALGHPTTIERLDARWPMLVTKVIDARGHTVLAAYDSLRAVLLSTTDMNPNASSAGLTTGNAVTNYSWHPRWDRVTEIVAPMNLTTHITYDATTGNRLEQSVGSTHTNRTTFGYDPTTRFVSSIATTQSATPTRLDYDAVGNLWHTTTPKGFVATTIRDAIGRDSVVRSPVDSAQTQFRTQSYLYDVAGRLMSSVDSALAGSIAQTVRIANAYDDEGHPITVWRSTTPDTAHVGTLFTDYTYDPAGRKLTDHDRAAPDNQVARWHYDASGNVIEADTKAFRIMTMQYDALNRLSHRTIPRVGDPYGSVDDIQDFTYDDVGNLLTATSPFAQVARTYTLGGELEGDSLAIHAADLTAGGMAHGYRLVNHYDVAGRRIAQDQPANLSWIVSGGSVTTSSNSYGYDSETGALATVTDQRGNTFRYHHNSAGLLDSLLMPGGIVETHFYDDDSREYRRLEVGPMGTIHDDHSFRDAAGRALSVSVAGLASAGGGGDFTYAGLGPVTRSAIDVQDFETIQLSSDGFGHTIKKQQAGTESDPGTKLYQYAYEAGSNRLLQVNGQLGTTATDVLTHGYDATGNLTQQSYTQTTPMTVGEGTTFIHVDASWSVAMGYDAAGRLLTADRSTVNDHTNWQNDLYHRRTQAAINTGYGSYEEYRYDPLGRRVWKRTHRDSYCTDEARAQLKYQAECASAITVTVWDGDQALYEIRAAAADNLSASQIEHNIDSPIGSGTPFGQFSGLMYLHGAGIDRPLELIRVGEVVVFHTSWRGAIDASTNTSGQFSTCGLSNDGSCVKVKWPGQEMGLTYIRPYTALEAVPWYGDLSQGQLDASGKMYMRNRYYDPVTGRFTQEDPIGLGGGTNLYGFGGGDPVNFSDPFGLCTPWPDCMLQGMANWGAAHGGSVGAVALNVGAGLNAASEAFGTNDFGKAVGNRDGVGAAVALAGMLPVGRAGRAGRLVEEVHHLLPRQFKAQFARVGLNIEEYTMKLTREVHRLKPDGLHTAAGGNWNQVWRDFFKENPNATRGAILDQLDRMTRSIRK